MCAGMNPQIANALQAMVGAPIAVEAETGEPVARRLAEAVERFEGLFRWSKGLTPEEWARRALWKRRNVPRRFPRSPAT
jgi:hypothetical protein